MANKIRESELSKLSELQNELHTLDEKNVGGKIITLFRAAPDQILWSSTRVRPFKISSDKDTTVFECPDLTYSYLTMSYLNIFRPRIQVKTQFKDKVRIKLCNNFTSNMIIESNIKCESEIIDISNRYTSDINKQFFDNSKEEDNEWTTEIPEDNFILSCEWYYNDDDRSLAFPIYFKANETKLLHNYRFCTRISELIRVQVGETADGVTEWKNLNPDHYGEYIDLPNIPIPQLYGYFSIVDDKEIESYDCDVSDSDVKIRNYFYQTWRTHESPESFASGTIANVNMEINSNVTEIFWMVRNEKAGKINNLSNYTDNFDDIKSGKDPIKSTTMIINNETEFDNMESHHFNKFTGKKFFKSIPRDAGYHGYSFIMMRDPMLAVNNRYISKLEMKCQLHGNIGDKSAGAPKFIDEKTEIPKQIPLNDNGYKLVVCWRYYRIMTLREESGGKKYFLFK